MYSQNARQAMKAILKECITEGTFWYRHFQSDDVIDIWRAINRDLAEYKEEPAPFDAFYLALQKFRQDYLNDFEAAAEALISKLEAKTETVLAEKETPIRQGRWRETPQRLHRIQRTAGGGIKVTGIFTPREQEPIEVSVLSSEDDLRRLYDYFNRYHDDFTHDLVFGFFSGVQYKM